MCGGGGRFVDIYTTAELLWLWLHFHTVSGDFVVTASVARAAELLVVRRPVSLITSPVLEPPHFNWNSSLHISPIKLFGFLSSRVHKFWTAGAKVSGFARSSRQLSATSHVKRVGRPRRGRELCLAGCFLPESRGNRTEGERTVFLLSILSFSPLASVCVWSDEGCGGGGVFRRSWGEC